MSGNFSYIIIATEILSILFCLVLLFGGCFESNDKSARGKNFNFLVIVNISTLALDVACYLLDGVPGWYVVKIICNALAIVTVYVLFGGYVLYLRGYIEERANVAAGLFKGYNILCIAGIAVSVVACFTGRMFKIVDDVSEYGPLYTFHLIMVVILVLYCAVITTIYHKVLGRHDSIAAYLYLIFPILSAICSCINEKWAFGYVAATISLLIIYVMLQSEKNNRLQEERNVSTFHAVHDELTGLLNRKAYIDRLNELSTSEDSVGVIFGDVNGLKYENDHYGHVAGDRLIMRMAESLNRHFRHEEIYRISGDEFVVLAKSVKKDFFEQRTANLEKTLMENGRQLACIGAEYGSCLKVNELVQMAETNMYKQKDAFYKQFPEMKR